MQVGVDMGRSRHWLAQRFWSILGKNLPDLTANCAAPIKVLVRQVRVVRLLCAELHDSVPKLGQMPTDASDPVQVTLARSCTEA
jgi:hypothetical protein